MSHVNMCIKHQGIRYVGGLYMTEVDFSPEIPDTSNDAPGTIRDKSKRGLIPLTEENIGRMADYLIEMMNAGYPFEKPAIVVDFDTRSMLVNERRTQNLMNYEGCAGKLFKYHKANQRQIDEAILIPDKRKLDN